jgi:plastocyanin
MKTNKPIAVISALALIMLAACGGGGTTAPANSNGNSTGNQTGGGSTTPASNQIIASGSANVFDPASLTVTLGTTVSFTFESVGHNVVFDASVSGRPADITGTNSNTTITRTFSTAGTFNYQCTIHAGMTGTVIVTN